MAEKRHYTKLEFTAEEETQIIDFVKDNPVLYNPKNADYKNKVMKDQLWEDLGKRIKKTDFFHFEKSN